MFNMHTVLTSERCLPVRPCGCCDVSLRLFWQFLCVFPLSVYQSISSVWRKFSVPPFSCFLLPSVLSCLSQSAELQTKIVSLRAWLCSVCVCVHVYTQRYDRVYIQGDGDISLFVCFFPLCVCLPLSWKNVDGYIWAKRPSRWGVTLPIAAFFTSYTSASETKI